MYPTFLFCIIRECNGTHYLAFPIGLIQNELKNISGEKKLLQTHLQPLMWVKYLSQECKSPISVFAYSNNTVAIQDVSLGLHTIPHERISWNISTLALSCTQGPWRTYRKVTCTCLSLCRFFSITEVLNFS